MEERTAQAELEAKIVVLEAFLELAWSDGPVTESEASYLSELADEMSIPLGVRIPLLARGLTEPPLKRVDRLGEIITDEEERYEIAEKLVGLCFISPELSFKQTQALANLALQLKIPAEQLEEMRLRVC